jgi:hypothetical protein
MARSEHDVAVMQVVVAQRRPLLGGEQRSVSGQQLMERGSSARVADPQISAPAQRRHEVLLVGRMTVSVDLPKRGEVH